VIVFVVSCAVNLDFRMEEGLEGILSCFICAGMLQDAVLCPRCGAMACRSCLSKWVSSSNTCPQCRCVIRVGELVTCRLAMELSERVSRSRRVGRHRVGKGGVGGVGGASSTTGMDEDEEERCPKHDLPLRYFCVTCSKLICSDCAVFSADHEHEGHTFEKVSSIVERKMESLMKDMEKVQGYIKRLQRYSHFVDKNVQKLEKSKDHSVRKLRGAVRQMEERLEAQHRAKESELLSQKTNLSTVLDQIQSIGSEISSQIHRRPQTAIIRRIDDWMVSISKASESFAKISEPVTLGCDFVDEIYPPYRVSPPFIVHLVDPGPPSTSPQYSDVFETFGVAWRLKVYPRGNGSAKDKYIR
jgi:hypothetical protein